MPTVTWDVDNTLVHGWIASENIFARTRETHHVLHYYSNTAVAEMIACQQGEVTIGRDPLSRRIVRAIDYSPLLRSPIAHATEALTKISTAIGTENTYMLSGRGNNELRQLTLQSVKKFGWEEIFAPERILLKPDGLSAFTWKLNVLAHLARQNQQDNVYHVENDVVTSLAIVRGLEFLGLTNFRLFLREGLETLLLRGLLKNKPEEIVTFSSFAQLPEMLLK